MADYFSPKGIKMARSRGVLIGLTDWQREGKRYRKSGIGSKLETSGGGYD